jgi:pimeloyl-ACP methyl ester carboxylesterase
VFTPTLTSLADRSHLLAAGIGLGTHIADVVNLLKWERLRDVVLVGHSYGGMVVAGVAEAMRKAIASLVLLDAFLPEDGQALIDLATARRDDTLAAERRSDVAVPPPPAAFFKVNERDRAMVDALCTPQPIRTFIDPVRLTGAREGIARKTYVRASDFISPAFDAALARTRQTGWRTIEIAIGRDLMLDTPERTASILIEAAR